MREAHNVDDYTLPTFFKLHDANNDRLLDRRELAVLYGGHDIDVDLETLEINIVQPILDKFDSNGDGKLSVQEYQAALEMDVGQPGVPVEEPPHNRTWAGVGACARARA